MAGAAYRTQRLEVLHNAGAALHRVGALDQAAMRDLDAFCMTPVGDISGAYIRKLREREGVSQAVLARHLNVGTKLVSDWERGAKRPSGPSLKFLVLASVKEFDTILLCYDLPLCRRFDSRPGLGLHLRQLTKAECRTALGEVAGGASVSITARFRGSTYLVEKVLHGTRSRHRGQCSAISTEFEPEP
jgi:putative transcriptional regulator